jgi:hypothetical protein
MKKSLVVLALVAAVSSAYAQDTNVNSGSTSGSNSGATSGSSSNIQSGSATSTAIGNQAASGSQSSSQSGAQSGSQSGALGNVVNIDQRGPTSTTSTNTNTSTANVSSSSRNTDNVNYSGTVTNRVEGGTYSTVNENVHYSGTQTIKNVPGIAMSGPASGPCTGASGGLGLAGPGFGVGLNGAKVDDGCTVRENTRILGQLYQSLASDNPAKMEAQAALLEGMAIIRNMNAAIGGSYAPKPQPKTAEAAPAAEPAKVVTQAPTPILMPATNVAAVAEPTDPYVRARMGLPKLK